MSRTHKLRYVKRFEGINFTIVGVGGTGGFVAESLCRLMIGTPGRITLVDHDRVERHNIMRQNFYERDIGSFKSEALANRLTRNYGRAIEYCTTRFETGAYRDHPGMGRDTGVLIGCVDNSDARLSIQKAIETHRGCWWIDAGNGSDWGQILIGNSTAEAAGKCAFTAEWCTKLPMPTVQIPQLLDPTPQQTADLDCAAAILLSDQDPTINQTMATLTVALARQIVTGACETMALYVDQKHGTVTPRHATPENVAEILKTDAKMAMADHGADERCDHCVGYRSAPPYY